MLTDHAETSTGVAQEFQKFPDQKLSNAVWVHFLVWQGDQTFRAVRLMRQFWSKPSGTLEHLVSKISKVVFKLNRCGLLKGQVFGVLLH